ncbi:hypothetical protein FRACYDRAFT_251549 [Fragilariopsis cylindrus CCMP1102]|uniref:Methyltransferase domain-containing protein n=1 Tax=Fragilariopsis cylindrus CCMP1102 TaxID=635003 RepID=A0A1E7EMN0_9STRA|nr:hypothetical protein FRACYDRAFT_251549 [Fragilariopsis cylindrus CCMP1102]|eukprot:OEU07209.1 hypothetical protein FRACYDRAFT_251549 [Fragilariopsis cylindrus CCMP1102]
MILSSSISVMEKVDNDAAVSAVVAEDELAAEESLAGLTLTTPTTTPTREEEDNDDDDDNLKFYFNEINKELQYLSKLHKMKERNGDGPTKTINNNKRRSGRTRPLKPRNAIDFIDIDDIENNENDIEIDESATTTTSPQHNTKLRRDDGGLCLRHQRQLFNKFARTVCFTNVIPRKEIFEAWAMALYVHYTFLSTTSTSTSTSTSSTTSNRRRPKIKRIADLVCSHGLLSWALLLLSSEEEESESVEEKQEEKEVEGVEEVQQQQQQEEEEEEEVENKKTANISSPTKTKSLNLTSSISAVCIDLKMPKSSETVATVFKETFYNNSTAGECTESNLDWNYVEGPIEYIIPHSSTLLVGIHACGTLSDKIIDLAISSNSSLALVPCCHTKKQFTADQQNNFLTQQQNYSLTDFIDNYRKQKLIDHGYTVHEIFIPSEFTPKNRILLCIPPPIPIKEEEEEEEVGNDYVLINYKDKINNSTTAKINPINNNGFNSNKWWKIPFKIPIGDTMESKLIIQSLSGRDASIQRKQDSIPTPSLCISVWISSSELYSNSNSSYDKNKNKNKNKNAEKETETAALEKVDVVEVKKVSSPLKEDEENDGEASATTTTTPITISMVEDLSLEDLQRIIDQTQHIQIQTQTLTKEDFEFEFNDNKSVQQERLKRKRIVEAVYHVPYKHPNDGDDGRYARTYKIHYYDCITKAEAKKYHKLLREIILPKYLPNVTIRY